MPATEPTLLEQQELVQESEVRNEVVAAEPEPLSVQYTNLLHQYRAPNAPEVREFRKMHKSDKVFRQCARTLDALFLMRKLDRSL